MSQLIFQWVGQINNIILANRNYCGFLCSCTVQGYFDPNALIVTLNSNGQGLHYLSDKGNTYYVAIDANNNIKPLLESEIANVS